jgi:hypothetical protein
MKKIPFFKKLITCLLAGLVVGAFVFRQGVTFLRPWVQIRTMSLVQMLVLVAAIIYAFIWQARKTNKPGTLAFWQGLIRYGVAYDLASFGWEKIFHLQLGMPLSWQDRLYGSFQPSELFWSFYSYSYLFGCLIASFQIIGAMLLLFQRTRLVGVFILLPVLANILMMDIFYQIGNSVVVHASIMMSGVLYFLFIEFDRLKAFFFASTSGASVASATNWTNGTSGLPSLQLSRYLKIVIRLSIIYIPLLLIAMHGSHDKYPELTGKYEVKQLSVNRRIVSPGSECDSSLNVVYFDIRNGAVFEFGTPLRRWSGDFAIHEDSIHIRWRMPASKPDFNGVLSPVDGKGQLGLTGILGSDTMNMVMQKVMK